MVIYVVRDTIVKVGDLPNFVDVDYNKDFGLPSEESLDLATPQSGDNWTPVTRDPLNWYIFDPGNETNPQYVTNELYNPSASTFAGMGSFDATLDTYGQAGSLQPLPVFGSFNDKYSFGTNFTFYPNGGPRNKGYTKIDEGTWIKHNAGLGDQKNPGPGGGAFMNPFTQVWRSGSLEFTIKPEKSNCTITSGSLFPQPTEVTPGPASGTAGDGPTLQKVNFPVEGLGNPNGSPGSPLPAGQIPEMSIEVPSYYFYPSEKLTWAENDKFAVNPDAGLILQNIQHAFRTFSVKLVNGKLKIIYTIHYGTDKKTFEVDSNTNIVDGKWHHIVINRPNQNTKKNAEQKYLENGCLEIWIDGKLDITSYEITKNMLLPVPTILFNDSLNVGVLNIDAQFENVNARYIPYTYVNNYVGGIRDYIFRHLTPLSNHEIHLNYVYAMLNDEGARIIKQKTLTAEAKIIQPIVVINKPKVLKLYWNTLLKDKEKCLNGLEFDENYQVYSYSTTHKNVLSPTQTMNLDLNKDKKDPTFLVNVKTAMGKPVFTTRPGLQYFTQGVIQQLDFSVDSIVMKQFPQEPFSINNLFYGGVTLNEGDKVLLFNQPSSIKNGVWIYNGQAKPLTRPSDISAYELENKFVYVEEGNYANTTFYQDKKINNLRNDGQNWVQVDNEISIAKLQSYPIHGNRWINSKGDQDFINVNTDIDFDYDIIAFANFPDDFADVVKSLQTLNEIEVIDKYKNFINNLKIAVNAGKSIFISSPQLAVDFGIVNKVNFVPQLLNTESDAQSAAISPFESGEAATNYFDTHRNNKYHLTTPLNGLTNKETYIMTDFVTYSPDRTKSDYHIKYNYRQFGLLEGDEFYIPGLTILPETLNEQLPGYLHNQKSIKDIPAFAVADINYGTAITKMSNNVYSGSTLIPNPYDDYITTIAGNYGSGKVFVNCVENAYAFSREDYNKGIIQNVTAGQNAETVTTAAWQYSTKRLNKKDLYDFSENANPIGQTDPTLGGGGGIVQSQSHCSNAFIRKQFTKNDLKYQSDLYPDYAEEFFTTTEIPVLSMTWLGLKWLAE
jgi:hypothetical protein